MGLLRPSYQAAARLVDTMRDARVVSHHETKTTPD
jgi:hypothetical protein